jgi:hypothetical protein
MCYEGSSFCILDFFLPLKQVTAREIFCPWSSFGVHTEAFTGCLVQGQLVALQEEYVPGPLTPGQLTFTHDILWQKNRTDTSTNDIFQ